MQVRRITREDVGEVQGVVVAIDVIRAFTVAAHALAGGADRLWLVRTTDEAFALHRSVPSALLAGEVNGYLIPGFDLNNSPALMARSDVAGRTIIQRTGAGTQGAAGAVRADRIVVCSLVNARATTALLHDLDLPVTLLPTGSTRDDPNSEDELCADYIEALLLGRDGARSALDAGLARLRATDRLAPFATGHSDFPPEDIAHAFDVDRFPFAMPGNRRRRHGITYVEVTALPVALQTENLL